MILVTVEDDPLKKRNRGFNGLTSLIPGLGTSLILFSLKEQSN